MDVLGEKHLSMCWVLVGGIFEVEARPRLGKLFLRLQSWKYMQKQAVGSSQLWNTLRYLMYLHHLRDGHWSFRIAPAQGSSRSGREQLVPRIQVVRRTILKQYNYYFNSKTNETLVNSLALGIFELRMTISYAAQPRKKSMYIIHEHYNNYYCHHKNRLIIVLGP